MKIQLRFILVLSILLPSLHAFAWIEPDRPGAKGEKVVNPRSDCAPATRQYDLAINNVRARLLNGGDIWWDLSDGQYIVPKVDPALGVPGVSSLFAGAVWLGGFDDAGNLKMAAQTYRNQSNNDFWPGPLSSVGTTEASICQKWDQFFIVKGVDIRAHINAVEDAEGAGRPIDCDAIPESLKRYPGRGNPFWSQYYDFDLPSDTQGVGAFHDADEDGYYNPCAGDYPAIEVRGCPTAANFPDEIVFWVYNDAGNTHTNTNGTEIRMEVQVQAFAYTTNDQINDMTFYRYKLINRAVLAIDSTYFGMWIDPDLGCPDDDFIGSDTTRSMMYVYNQDGVDGTSGCDCNIGGGPIPTYCNHVPILGVDYFRGPLGPVRQIDSFDINLDFPLDPQDYPFIYDTIETFGDTIVLTVDKRQELGMSSFTYHIRQGSGPWPASMQDPTTAQEFYNYLSGTWRDGSRYVEGGSGFSTVGGTPTNYVFTGDPSNLGAWSMCSANLGQMDPRTVQATGPFRLDPGAINELIIGVVWVPDQVYPCPDLTELRAADDLAQALFDNCFILPSGPDAPDLDWIELDRELICILSNDRRSNNYLELYEERGLEVPADIIDSNYVFEGYLVYQLASGNVTTGELDDPSKARLIFQVDKRNGINKLFNWTTVKGPNGIDVWVPVEQIAGADQGIRHSFRITEDQFASGLDRRLVNHKHYYFTAIAYAYNEYEPFDPNTLIGQRRPYLEGRQNIRTYDPLPHPQTFKTVNAFYGEGPLVTRLDGVGAGETFLMMAEGEHEKILAGEANGEVTYASGASPVRVFVFNPLVVKDGDYILEFADPNPTNTKVLSPNTGWRFYDANNPDEYYLNEKPLAELNEQLIADLGIAVFIGQSDDAGDKKDPTNGTIGYSLQYKDPAGPQWLTFVGDDFAGLPQLNFVQTEIPDYPNFILDPERAYSTFSPFVPFVLTDLNPSEPSDNPAGWNITPGWLDVSAALIQLPQNGGILQNLNNVDIVITPDKSKWSRCVVIETATLFYYNSSTATPPGLGLNAEGGKRNFQSRSRLSVGKDDVDGDGFPDPDGELDANGNPLTGMGWFPGYAVDVETGERLNIFFGENSAYGPDLAASIDGLGPEGFDMVWNPGKNLLIPGAGTFDPFSAVLGGQQFVYVTRQKYDGCDSLKRFVIDRPQAVFKAQGLGRTMTWTAIPLMVDDPNINWLPLNEGLIPNEVTIRLRVDNPYQKAIGTGINEGYPSYRISFRGVSSAELTTEEIPQALSAINVVPNPYYAYSEYETSSFANTVKITNLPPKCVVTIYSLDGRFIRQYTRNEVGKSNTPERENPPVAVNQVYPDLEWNLKNFAGIPIASGVYLIHVNAPGLGERVIKWFGVSRQFDPSGL